MTNYSDRHGKVHVGIDASKRTLDVCILREDALKKGESFVVTNDREGVEEILSRLAEKPGASVELAVMEATGRYERLTVTMLAASSISVAIVNPRQAPGGVHEEAALHPQRLDEGPRYLEVSSCPDSLTFKTVAPFTRSPPFYSPLCQRIHLKSPL